MASSSSSRWRLSRAPSAHARSRERDTGAARQGRVSAASLSHQLDQLLPEVAGYPESGKTGIRLGMGEAADVRYLLRDADKDASRVLGRRGRARGVEKILAKARTVE